MSTESRVRLERVHQAFDRSDRGRSIDGSKLTAEEIYLALNPRYRVALLELRPLINRLRPVSFKILTAAQRFSMLFS